MITDLHNHTNFSYDGTNSPEEIIENAIRHGIDVIGICDHQFSLGDKIYEYTERINSCKIKYKDKIKVLTGLEIGTRPKPNDLLVGYVNKNADYVLFESLDSSDMRTMDLYEFFEWRKMFECKIGLAHTDIFALCEKYGVDMLTILKTDNIFWEINTSGNYGYYYDFLTNAKKRELVKNSGISVSIGSDTHAISEFDISKIRRANQLIDDLGNRKVY